MCVCTACFCGCLLGGCSTYNEPRQLSYVRYNPEQRIRKITTSSTSALALLDAQSLLPNTTTRAAVSNAGVTRLLQTSGGSSGVIDAANSKALLLSLLSTFYIPTVIITETVLGRPHPTIPYAALVASEVRVRAFAFAPLRLRGCGGFVSAFALLTPALSSAVLLSL